MVPRNAEKSRDVVSIVTGDMTWFYHYDIPSKARNKIKIGKLQCEFKERDQKNDGGIFSIVE